MEGTSRQHGSLYMQPRNALQLNNSHTSSLPGELHSLESNLAAIHSHSRGPACKPCFGDLSRSGDSLSLADEESLANKGCGSLDESCSELPDVRSACRVVDIAAMPMRVVRFI